MTGKPPRFKAVIAWSLQEDEAVLRAQLASWPEIAAVVTLNHPSEAASLAGAHDGFDGLLWLGASRYVGEDLRRRLLGGDVARRWLLPGEHDKGRPNVVVGLGLEAHPSPAVGWWIGDQDNLEALPGRVGDTHDAYTDTGLYLVNKAALAVFAPLVASQPGESAPRLALALWHAHQAGGRTPFVLQGFALAEQRVAPQQLRPCLFLDRDGVIIEDRHYAYRTDDLVVIPAIVPLIRWAKARGWFVVVVSNQAGVARGLFSEADLTEAHAYLDRCLAAAEAAPHAWYAAPFHPDAKVAAYRGESLYRKPLPGMLLKAAREWPIDLAASLMVGDKDSDVIALPGLRCFLVAGQYPLSTVNTVSQQVFASHTELCTALFNLE